MVTTQIKIMQVFLHAWEPAESSFVITLKGACFRCIIGIYLYNITMQVESFLPLS